jgi:hypothetical protein
MRESCLVCVRKHIAQAIILLTESKLGHSEHKWLAIGHLAEAEAESVQMFPEFANKIRNERLKLIEDNYDVYLIELIKKAGQLKEQEERDSEKS